MKSFIEEVVSSLTLSELSTLENELDKKTPTYDSKFKNLNTNSKGIKLSLFREGFFNKRLGILVYNNSWCSFFEYNGCNLKPYKINVENHTSECVECCELTKTDLRRMVDDYKEQRGGSGSAWAELMKDKIYIDENGICQHTEPSEFQENATFDGQVKVVDIDKIKNEDGNTIIPCSEPNKVLVGGSNFVYQLETPSQLLNAPATGTYVLKSVNGALTWEEE